MLPGPVFNVELVTTARRRRYYAIRVVYGLFLLWIIWQNYDSLGGRSAYGVEFSIKQLAKFAQWTFSSFATLQVAAVLGLTPALVAGVIADEHRRKTLHYLLASRLSGAEIVLGKLMARLLHVLVFLAIGLPVVAGLTLFGGIDPDDVLRTDVGTATTAFALAGLSILVSTVTRRARDAILVTYLLELVWLIVPSLLASWLPYQFPTTSRPFVSALESLAGSSPIAMLWMLSYSTSRSSAVARMCAMQMAFGLAAVALAVLRLRPGFRAQGEGRRFFRRVRVPKVRRRLFPRPACGDDPMLWKECHVSRMGGVARFVAAMIGACLLLGLGYETAVLGYSALKEVAVYGYGSTGTLTARWDFNGFLRFLGMTGLYVLCAIGTAATAAGGVTGEKEGDTWTSLTASDLTGADILRAKMIGAVWGMRWLLAMMAVQGVLGVAAGALHPFGLIAVTVQTAVFLWFAAALGTLFSLHMKSTTKALAATVATLLILNGGYLICCLPMGGGNSPIIALGCSPAILGLSALSYSDMTSLFAAPTNSFAFGPKTTELFFLCVLGTAFYAGLALVLSHTAIGGFDRAIDRPDRTVRVPPPCRDMPPAPADEP